MGGEIPNVSVTVACDYALFLIFSLLRLIHLFHKKYAAHLSSDVLSMDAIYLSQLLAQK